jgi:hypothetical protein
MYPNNIIMPKYQTAARPTTDLLVGSFYSDEEVLQAELWRALAKGSFTQLLELKALFVKPISQPSQNITKSIRRNFGTFLESYSDIFKYISQYKNSFKNKNISRSVKIKNYGISQC